MYFRAIAIYLDGTIAKDGKISNDAWSTLEEAKASGFFLILLPGRRLTVIPELVSFEKLCYIIVAKNGSAIYYQSNGPVLLPFGHLAKEGVQELEHLNISLEKGLAIASTWVPQYKKILKILKNTKRAATKEYNKGAKKRVPAEALRSALIQEVSDRYEEIKFFI